MALRPSTAHTQVHFNFSNMFTTTGGEFHKEVIWNVTNSPDICVAIDQQLYCLALNEMACSYLNIKPEDLLGKSALQVYPEIVASRNHRNILKALTGIPIISDLVESRKGDILRASYQPVFVDNEVRAVILNAVVCSQPGK
jgi:PAS domain-containing protein